MHFFPFPCHLVPLWSKYLSQQHFLKHTQPMFLLIVADQVSHPHKTKVKIIVLYTLIFTFLDSKREKTVLVLDSWMNTEMYLHVL
jgi:hypothetical protein